MFLCSSIPVLAAAHQDRTFQTAQSCLDIQRSTNAILLQAGLLETSTNELTSQLHPCI